jgi:Protein of unknown function (DUF2474)
MSAAPPGPLYKRLLWLAAIWSLSVAALALVAFALRFVAAL